MCQCKRKKGGGGSNIKLTDTREEQNWIAYRCISIQVACHVFCKQAVRFLKQQAHFAKCAYRCEENTISYGKKKARFYNRCEIIISRPNPSSVSANEKKKNKNKNKKKKKEEQEEERMLSVALRPQKP